MSLPCRKAIIAVAGVGSRWLPLTKAIEKCMLPVGNRPVIDYIVDDCVRAGITDIYFVVSEQSAQIRQYYSSNDVLYGYLEHKGKAAEAAELKQIDSKANFHFVTQTVDMPYGTAIPVQICLEQMPLEAGEPVVVLMGDQFTFSHDGRSEVGNLLEAIERQGVSSGMVVSPVPIDEVSKYGIVALDDKGYFKQIVEKPAPQDAPSTLNNLSMYVFDSDMLQCVADVQTPTNGEYYLTDALNSYVAQGKRLAVVNAIGTYLDGGTVEGLRRANDFVASTQNNFNR